MHCLLKIKWLFKVVVEDQSIHYLMNSERISRSKMIDNNIYRKLKFFNIDIIRK